MAVTFRDVFAIGEFRGIWSAELCSNMGDQLARVALSVLVFRGTGSAALTALTYALTFVPSLAGGVLLAGLADRFPRRAVMVTTDLIRAALLAGIAIPKVPLWVLWLLVAAVSLLNPVFKAAQLAILPDVLPGERYPVGMAIRATSIQLAQLVGFGAGGLLLVAVPPRVALVADAATFLASAAVLRATVRSRPAAAGAVRPGWWASMRRGLREAFANRERQALMLVIWLMALITVYEGLAAPYAAALGGGPAVVGAVLCSDPLGSAVGLLVFGRWTPAHLRDRLILPFAALASAVLTVCLLHPGLVVSMLAFIVSGAFGSIVVMQATTALTTAVPDASRGQVLGVSNTGLTTASGLSPLAAGILADHVEPQVIVGVFGFGGTVAALLIAAGLRARRPVATGP